VERDQTVEGVLYDTTFLLDSKGSFVGRYRKTHLYPDEHRLFRAGDALQVFKLEGIQVGTAICFEHAFPQIFTILALKGAQIVFIPSAVPAGYEYLLDLRTRARAQDNQIFVVAANRCGTDGSVTYCGLSKIVNPRGDVIAEAGAKENRLITAECYLNLILKERTREPVFGCLRPDLYRSLFSSGV